MTENRTLWSTDDQTYKSVLLAVRKPSHNSFSNVEGVRRFRTLNSMSGYDQRPQEWGTPIEALHACPAHGLADVPPFCPVCLGAGTVTAARLSRYEYELAHPPAGT